MASEALSEVRGLRVFESGGDAQSGVLSLQLDDLDCEEAARRMAAGGVALRAGLHCAPLAHQSAGTLDSGTVRISFGHDAAPWQTGDLLQKLTAITGRM